jgi:hypothetical protein
MASTSEHLHPEHPAEGASGALPAADDRERVGVDETAIGEFEIVQAVNAMKCTPLPFSDYRDDASIDFLADEAHRGRLDHGLLRLLTATFVARCGRFGGYPFQPMLERMLNELRVTARFVSQLPSEGTVAVTASSWAAHTRSSLR